MSAQEATAAGARITASHLVPLVVEFLRGNDVEEIV